MKSSVFVRIDKYRELNDALAQLRAKLDDAKTLLGKIKNLKHQEDAELDGWQGELSTVEQKLAEISSVMTER